MGDRKPVIGVSRCSKLGDYIASVQQAGGDVRVLEFDEDPGAVIRQIDGLVLTGGGDVDPVVYGEPRHPSVEDAEPGRDEFELDLARRAIAADLPTLAICRGAQVLNVAAGGTLVQDIPTAVGTTIPHTIERPDAMAHTVEVVKGSQLDQALGGPADAVRRCLVNSRHHQSAGRIGDALVTSARSEDGVVEAIERPHASFCLGVQWHPENFWRTGEFTSLFERFVDAARLSHERRHP
jgi:putative glutamine amidotransferase